MIKRVIILFMLMGCLCALAGHQTGIRHWRFEGAADWTDPNDPVLRFWFDPTATNASGEIIESSTNANHGTMMPSLAAGAVWFVIGTNASSRVEHAYEFDRGDDYISVSSNSAINFGDVNFTIAAWFKTTFALRMEMISNYHVDNEIIRLSINTNGFAEGGTRDSAGVINSITTDPITVTNGTWHHLVLTRSTDDNLKILYLDVLETERWTDNRTGDFIDDVGANEYRIGSSHNARFYGGQIDDVRMYNIALSSNAVGVLHTNTYHPNGQIEVGY